MNINYEGLVCYLNSNKNSKQNNVWLDSSGNNNNATLTSFSDNDFNGSYVQFNGNNYAVIPRCIQDDFTLSAEVILESSTSTAEPWQLWYNYASLIDAETVGVHNDFGLTISKDGHAYLGIGNPDRTIPYVQKSLFNEKHIITCTRKKDTGEYAMYIDGILIKKEIHPNKNSLTYPSEIYVGKGINNRFLSMKLFSIRIYNRVLDNFEIKQDNFFVKNKVYVNENNLPIIVDKLTDAKNIKISNNKYGNRVQTVVDKIVEKADDVTKAIKQEVINDSYSFKVGTGDVDVSTDVEDGFGEVGIKGVTYQNIAYKNTSIPSNCSYSKETGEGIVNYNASHLVSFNFSTDLLKPNTLYTVIINIKENSLVTTSGNSLKLQMADNNIAKYVTNGFVGQLKATISTKEISSSFGIVTVTAGATEGRVVFDGYMVLEGDHVDKSSIPSKISNIVGVGDKSKNLFNGELELGGYTGSTGTPFVDSTRVRTKTKIPLSSGDYVVSSEESTLISACEYNVDGTFIREHYANSNNKYFKLEGDRLVHFQMINPNLLNSKIQLEKGTTPTEYQPPNTHKIEILSHGKNLFNNKNNFITGGSGFAQTVGQMVTLSEIGDSNHKYLRVKLPIGKKYTVTIDKRNTYPNGWTNTIIESISDNIIVGSTYKTIARNNNSSSQISMLTFETSMPYVFIHIGRKNNDQAYEEWFAKVLESFETMQIEEGSVATHYEPYQEDKTQILLDEPLMRLPNGVHDEITRDGKLIRRVGKIIFNGSENWKTAINNNKSRFDLSLNSVKTPSTWNDKTVPNMICSNLIVQSFNQIYSNGESGINYYHANSDRLIVISLGNNCSLAEFKQWLSQNPTTVYYELSTPVITELPAPCLRIFKDGHLIFNTLVAPESNHVVQLNKSAQIERNIREVQGLDNRINVLENNYDNLMLSTISRLNDLELDYTLK